MKTTRRYHVTLLRITVIKTKQNKREMLVRMWRKWKPGTLLVGM